MTKEVSGSQESICRQEQCANKGGNTNEDSKKNEGLLILKAQEAANQIVKDNLAMELAEMGLPVSVVHQILNIEDDLPF